MTADAERERDRNLAGLRVHPELFGDLTEDELHDRAEFFRLMHVDVDGSIKALLADTAPAPSLEHPVLRRITDFYQEQLERECQSNGHPEVAERVRSVRDQLLEAASRGRTRGEQAVALAFRHPDAVPCLPDDGRRRRRAHGLLGHIVTVREFEALRAGFDCLKDKRHREQRREALFSELSAAYPALKLGHPMSIVALTPEKAARLVFADRRGVSVDRSSALVAEARKAIRSHERVWAEIASRVGVETVILRLTP